MALLYRTLFAALVALTFSAGAAMARDGVNHPAGHGVTLFYFGSKECPYCRKFVKSQLDDMRAEAGAAGIRVVVSETAHLKDLRQPEPFDNSAVWSAVVQDSGLAVPAFGLVVDGQFVDSHSNWRKLMRKAVDISTGKPHTASR